MTKKFHFCLIFLFGWCEILLCTCPHAAEWMCLVETPPPYWLSHFKLMTTNPSGPLDAVSRRTMFLRSIPSLPPLGSYCILYIFSSNIHCPLLSATSFYTNKPGIIGELPCAPATPTTCLCLCLSSWHLGHRIPSPPPPTLSRTLLH